MMNFSERYIINFKDCIGVGFYSKVFKGFDKKCNRNCALKLFNLKVETIGEIPKTLFLENRLRFSDINFGSISKFILPSFSIAALAMIESLLCGAS